MPFHLPTHPLYVSRRGNTPTTGAAVEHGNNVSPRGGVQLGLPLVIINPFLAVATSGDIFRSVLRRRRYSSRNAIVAGRLPLYAGCSVPGVGLRSLAERAWRGRSPSFIRQPSH